MKQKIRVLLIHQGIWNMEKLSMPLALGYMKSMAMADKVIQEMFDIRIVTFGGGSKLAHIVPEIVAHTPDILGFSVYGWNYYTFGRVAETFKQCNPQGWCLFGGPHVSHQAARVFRMYPEVDIVVNGEGERSFVKLLHAYLQGGNRRDLSHIKGISFQDRSAGVQTTPNEERIEDLDEIPSPFLSGAMPLVNAKGEFLYDVAMMETNRGCPYKCAFCYWGGAVGQKVYKFSRQRLRDELELFARLGVENIALCDANFGILPGDQLFLDDLLELRAKYGYPRNIVTSWAKNKNQTFYRIVEKMHEHKLSGDFTLALQTLAPAAIESSNRKNMKLNDFEDLSQWLNKRGLPSYVELIWGLPGETYESFLQGYDRVARYTPRIATYTNMLLPNSEYEVKRREYKFISVRGDEYDFQCVLSHNTMSFSDNVKMHHFLFWSRILAEHFYFRHIWLPLRLFAGLSQSSVILDLNDWVQENSDSVCQELIACKHEVVDHLDASRIGRGLRALYRRQPQLRVLFAQWWRERIMPQVPNQLQAFFLELLTYDLATQPKHCEVGGMHLKTEFLFGQSYYVDVVRDFNYDFAGLNRSLYCDTVSNPQETIADFTVNNVACAAGGSHTLYFKTGFEHIIDSHESVLQYVAKTYVELEHEAQMRAQGIMSDKTQMHVVGLPDRSIAQLQLAGG